MRSFLLLACAAITALAGPAAAIDVANGKLTLSGFGEWGYGRTSNENAFAVGDEEGSYENAQFSLAATARPQDDLVVAGQLFVGRNGEVSLDWAFAEYRLSDLLRVRAGKVKNPFGLFMEVKDVGTLRPFFMLPQSVYGPTDFTAEAYLGAGVTGEWQAPSRWGVAYDAYVGALEIPSFEPGDAILEATNGPGVPPFDFTTHPVHEALATDVIGGRVALLTPVEGLTLRVSGYTGAFAQPGAEKERAFVYGVSAEYATDRLQVRGEWFRGTEGDAEVHVGGYAEVAWNVLPKLQLALRAEESRVDTGTPGIPFQFRHHYEGAIGVSYWLNANLVVKASFHRVDGNRFAVPAASALDGTVERRTDLVVAGAQFSF